MKTYVAQRPPDEEVGDCRVTVVDDQAPDSPQPLTHVKLHSGGFEWGYSGSGPADLALSILADHFGERPTRHQLHHGLCECWRYHQRFKRAFIAGAPRAGFEIASAQIVQWLASQQTEEA